MGDFSSTDIKRIAKVCHETNRAYCAAIGDNSQVAWSVAPAWQRESAIEGVRAMLEGRATSPEEQHDLWTMDKLNAGWTYGPVKDAEAKTHPCLVSYAELPMEQRLKDVLFRAVVTGMTA